MTRFGFGPAQISLGQPKPKMNCSPSLSVSRTPRCTHLHHSLQTWKRHCQNLAPFLSASLKKPLVYAETSPIGLVDHSDFKA
ncbi:hypothetical protein SDJN02_11337, partial [Cucurbita argyrosperma subsp. argyrosperma]